MSNYKSRIRRPRQLGESLANPLHGRRFKQRKAAEKMGVTRKAYLKLFKKLRIKARLESRQMAAV